MNICTQKKDRKLRRKTFIVRVMKKVAEKYASQFPKVQLFTVDELFGGWKKAQEKHFNDGGVFDKIYQK